MRDDMEMMLNKIVPEGLPYRHSCEGPDDMVSFSNCFILVAKCSGSKTVSICFSPIVSAGTREGVLPGQFADNSDNGWQAVARYVAGRVAVRAQGPCRQSEASDHVVGLSTRLRPKSPVARLTNRLHVQLGKAPVQ